LSLIAGCYRIAADPAQMGGWHIWRAVDAEGEVLDVLVQSKRSNHAALKLMRKLLKKYTFAAERLVTDDPCDHMAQGPALSASNACLSAGDGRTIGPKIRISRPDDGKARCNVSRALALRRNSSQSTPFTTSSTSNAISYQLNRTACWAPRR
jgi:DDE domain